MNDGSEQGFTLKNSVLHCCKSAIAGKTRARVDRNLSGVLDGSDLSGADSAGHAIMCR